MNATVPRETDATASAGRTVMPNYDGLSDQLDQLNKRYEYDFRFKPGDTSNAFKCKTIHEMVECLEKDPKVELEARVLHVNTKTKEKTIRRVKREAFISAFKTNERRFREDDSFGSDQGSSGANAGLIGDDFIPLLGGPFHKQLYLFDMLDQTQQAFWAYNHDPIAHRTIETIVAFVLGKGFRVDFKDPMHDALWEAFAKVNNMYDQTQNFCRESSMYGESMWWWLPNNETEININRDKNKFQIRKGFIPRIRVMDPSQFWDIITHPEDVNSVLAYQWVTPTQYQIYTHVNATGENVPGSKFIYQQIPADQIIHAKLNCVSNEKRGRSDLFPILGYLKRLRDTVNYSVIGMQKAAAWSMDTTIEGSQTDLDNYMSDQQALGTIPPAGSEFIHTSKIKREYLSNSATTSSGDPSAFIWCLNMIAAGTGIPISYYGTHLSGGQTRASAVVGTEPVSKLFENRQQFVENTIRKIIDGLMERNNISDYECKFTWPEIITQDRSQKLKDIYLAETAEWLSPKRAATMASKELGQDDYDFEQEREDIDKEKSMEAPTPLTAPPKAPDKPGANNVAGKPATSGLQSPQPVQKASGMDSGEKRDIRNEK